MSQPPELNTIVEQVTIAAPCVTVWAVLGDFHGLDLWLPEVEMETKSGDGIGAVREFRIGDAYFVERQHERDDDRFRLKYELLAGPLPVSHYSAEVAASAMSGATTRVVWQVQFHPESVEPEKCERMLRTALHSTMAKL